MNDMKKSSLVFALALVTTLSTAGMPFSVFAASKDVIAQSVPDAVSSARVDTSTPKLVNQDVINKNAKTVSSQSVSAQSASSIVAVLTIFADPNAYSGGSSGDGGIANFGSHAFITVKNLSSSPIQVGKFSGIAYGKTMSLGTWGPVLPSANEHQGLWYNLEAFKIYNYGIWPGRISLAYGLTASELNTLNSYIISHDSWANLNNCSSFASGAWNASVNSVFRLSAGYPNTPRNLANDIKAKFPTYYGAGVSVPYNYVVYYAQGTGSPKRSVQF